MAKVVATSMVKTQSGSQDLPLSLTHIFVTYRKVSFLWNKVYYHQTSKCLHMSALDLETSPCIELTKPLWSCRLSDVWQQLFRDFWHFMMLLLCQSGNLCHHLVSRCSSGWCNPQVTKWEVIWYLTIWWHWLADQITILYRDVGIVSSRPSRVLEPMMQHSLQKNQSIHVQTFMKATICWVWACQDSMIDSIFLVFMSQN